MSNRVGSVWNARVHVARGKAETHHVARRHAVQHGRKPLRNELQQRRHAAAPAQVELRRCRFGGHHLEATARGSRPGRRPCRATSASAERKPRSAALNARRMPSGYLRRARTVGGGGVTACHRACGRTEIRDGEGLGREGSSWRVWGSTHFADNRRHPGDSRSQSVRKAARCANCPGCTNSSAVRTTTGTATCGHSPCGPGKAW